VEKIFTWGRKFGIVRVLGVPKRSEDGFQIGAPEAAGGSDLAVSKKERDRIASESMMTRRFLAEKCFMARWVDDVVHVIPRKKPREVARVVAEMQQEDFYEGLELKPEDGLLGFGFEFLPENGLLLIRSVNKAEHDFENRGAEKDWPEVHGGTQYGGSTWKVATVVERISRLLDMTNEKQEDVMMQVRRCLAELCLQGFSRETISTALRKMRPSAWCDVMGAMDVMDMNEEEMRMYCMRVDLGRHLKRGRCSTIQEVRKKVSMVTYLRKRGRGASHIRLGSGISV
jgi:hypothetical protein